MLRYCEVVREMPRDIRNRFPCGSQGSHESEGRVNSSRYLALSSSHRSHSSPITVEPWNLSLAWKT